MMKIEDLKLKIIQKMEQVVENLSASDVHSYEPFELYYYLGFIAGLKTILETMKNDT